MQPLALKIMVRYSKKSMNLKHIGIIMSTQNEERENGLYDIGLG